MYPIVIFNALRLSDSRMVKSKAVYVAFGVTLDGLREVLGLWITENEGAQIWLSVMDEMKNRGTQDILISVADGRPRGHRHCLPAGHSPDLHRASGTPFPELLLLEGPQSRSHRPGDPQDHLHDECNRTSEPRGP